MNDELTHGLARLSAELGQMIHQATRPRRIVGQVCPRCAAQDAVAQHWEEKGHAIDDVSAPAGPGVRCTHCDADIDQAYAILN